MVTIKILKDLIEEMNYSGGINWNKMMPPEDERYGSKWVPLEEYEALNLNSKPSDNNDFKKPCPSCNGTGNVPERGFEYPDLCCPTCNGQGFIKS